MPEAMFAWLKTIGITEYSLCGTSSWGDGRHSDGTSNVTYSYIVKGIRETDCLAFKIQFPDCKVHIIDIVNK